MKLLCKGVVLRDFQHNAVVGVCILGSGGFCDCNLGCALGGVYSFGGSNVDNIEFGNTTPVALYNYESEILEGTITFDVKSFQVKYPLEAMWVEVPETTDPAYPGTTDVEFKKGQVVLIPIA